MVQAKGIVAFGFSGTVAADLPGSPNDVYGNRLELAVPGAARFFERIREGGHRVVVVSGGDLPEASAALPMLGVEPNDARFGVTDKAALASLALEGDVLAFVGHSERDVRGAMAAGVPPVIFDWHNYEDNPGRVERLRVRLTREGAQTSALWAIGFDHLQSSLMQLGVAFGAKKTLSEALRPIRGTAAQGVEL